MSFWPLASGLIREQRIADLRREIASPRPAHLSEAFYAAHIAAAQASLDRLLEMRPWFHQVDQFTWVINTDTDRGSDEDKH